MARPHEYQMWAHGQRQVHSLVLISTLELKQIQDEPNDGLDGTREEFK